MGQKAVEPDWLNQFETLIANGSEPIKAAKIIRGRQVKKQVANITSWADCKLALQQIIKDIYPTDPEG